MGSQRDPMYIAITKKWCNLISEPCSRPESIVTVCWDPAYTGSQFDNVRSIIKDEMSGYERYGRVTLVWKGNGVGSASACDGSEYGIIMKVRTTPGGTTIQRALQPNGQFQATTEIPDCNLAGGTGPIAQFWTAAEAPLITDEQCLRTVGLHEFGHALGFLHDGSSPESTDDVTLYGLTPPPNSNANAGSSTDCGFDIVQSGPKEDLGENGSNANPNSHLSRMNTCGGRSVSEAAYWTQKDLFPVEVAGIQRAYGRHAPGSFLTPGAQCIT
jgi:hypothetical protein